MTHHDLHSKIFSIFGFLLIPIVLVCLFIVYLCYKRYYGEKNLVLTNRIYFDDDSFDIGKPEQTTGL